MKALKKETQILRSRFLMVTRSFLENHHFIEVDTPILKPVVGMEPYLDPFLVHSPRGAEKGYLITSPEYSLKQSLASGLENIFEITHTFRSGEFGSPVHSKEFLMLELYAKNWNDSDLRKFMEGYFTYVFEQFADLSSVKKLNRESLFKSVTVEQAFIEHTGNSFSKSELINNIKLNHLSFVSSHELETWVYEDLFFLVFLNLVEPHLGDGIIFLFDYPPPCAALARVLGGRAKRFEIYWDGLEVANAFWELTDAKEQRNRFLEEQILRNKLGKEVFPIDEDFMAVLESGLFPDSAGISLGLDRMFMKLLGESSLEAVSPYYAKWEKNG